MAKCGKDTSLTRPYAFHWHFASFSRNNCQPSIPLSSVQLRISTANPLIKKRLPRFTSLATISNSLTFAIRGQPEASLSILLALLTVLEGKLSASGNQHFHCSYAGLWISD